MPDSYDADKQNRIRQLANKGCYDKAIVHGILDGGLVAHVAFSGEEGPVVVPMIYARQGGTIFLHGARKARVVRMLERGERVSLNVTLIDGIVLARSAFNSSMNYRSVTVFGQPRFIDDPDEKLSAMRCISEQLMPGRWDELRPSHEREIKMTGVLALPIEQASAKISAGDPDDEDEDYSIPIWAGVLPVTTTTGELLTDPRVADGIEPSAVVEALQQRKI